MSSHQLECVHPCGEASRPRVYSPGLQPVMQLLLATLADIEVEYERERQKLSRVRDDAVREWALHKAEETHRLRREPYAQQLAILQSGVRTLCGV